jgi:GTPase Era involved in 16S rRNA processing
MEKEKLEQHRIAALDLHEAITNKFQILPSTSLMTQYTNIVNKEFKVAVVGKVKSGKSTFINAILGEHLMPSDIREATCAIVEIFKSDTKYVSAKFLDGHLEEVKDNLDTLDIDEAHEFLKKVAAVQEKYRNIPIAKINDIIIKHFDKAKNESVFSESFIDEWIIKVNPENIHHLSTAEFTRKIKEYVEEHRNGYHIPLTIKVGFPHNFKFDQFRIIDTPGIGSTSGLGEKTKDYIEHVDAVLYLHKESPTEESLQNAWNNVISERAKKNTFLVLTHRSGKTVADLDALFEETKKTFPQIPKNRVFTVDSLTELAVTEFYGKEFEEIEKICDSNESYDQVCSTALRKSKGNVPELLNILERQSNMNGLKQELQKFSEKALSIQLHDFIVELRSHLESDECKQGFNLSACESKYRDPQHFSSAIEKQKLEIINLKNELNDKTAKIKEEFSLLLARGKKTLAFEKICSNFESEINGKEFARSDTRSTVESYVEKIYIDFYDKVGVFVKELKSEVIQQIKNQTSTLDGEYSISIPKVVFSEIWEIAAVKASGTKQKDVDRPGIWGWIQDNIFTFLDKVTERVPTFDIEKFSMEAKSLIIIELNKAKINISENADKMMNEAVKAYKNMIDKTLEDRELFLDVIKKDESSNEVMKIKIDALKERIVEIKSEIKECLKCEGELAC